MAKKPVAKLSKPVKRAIKQIVRGEAETKYTEWYGNVNDGTVNQRGTGFYNTGGWSVQNQAITANETDILRLIPQVLEGTGDFNRIGTRIRPVVFRVKGQLRLKLSLQDLLSTPPTNFTVDLYVLQHRRLKDYETLYGSNDFNQLLNSGEGTTVPYAGTVANSAMRISTQDYVVLARKRITLRYAGALNTATPGTTPVGVDNSHTFYAEYNMNLLKHLPKVLQFPDDNVAGVPVSPRILNAPTNSSVFLCMGYPSWSASSTNATAATANNSFLEQTYVATLGFKDM